MEKFENDFASIYYDPKLDAIVLYYKKQVPTGEFIPINQKVLDIFKKLKTHKFYVDTRKMGLVAVDGQKWVVENINLLHPILR